MSLTRINNTNMAQNAQRNLSLNTARISKSMEKLSSGLRINRAADDPAGLVMSESLRAQISGLDVGSRTRGGRQSGEDGRRRADRRNSCFARSRIWPPTPASDSTNTAETRAALQAQVDSA